MNQFRHTNIRMNNNNIITSQDVRNIGVQFDATLSMTSQVLYICKNSCVYIKNILKIKILLEKSSLEQIVQAFITSRNNNRNSLLCGVPTSEIYQIQTNIKLCSNDYHRFPQKWTFNTCFVLTSLATCHPAYKILLLIFKCINNMAPLYLQGIISAYIPAKWLWSQAKQLLMVPFSTSYHCKNTEITYQRIWKHAQVWTSSNVNWKFISLKSILVNHHN